MARAVAPAGRPRSASSHIGMAQPATAAKTASTTIRRQRSDATPAATPTINGTNQAPASAVAATTAASTTKAAAQPSGPRHAARGRARLGADDALVSH